MAVSTSTPEGVSYSSPSVCTPENRLDWIFEKMAPFFDYHFLFPIFEWTVTKYQSMGMPESANQINEMYIKLLSSTSMRTKMQNLCHSIQKDVTEGMSEKADKHEEEIACLEASTHSYIKALLAYKKEQQLRMSGIAERRSSLELCEWWVKQKPKMANLSELEKSQINKDYQPFSATVDDEMLRMAKLLYESGQYVHSKKILDLYLRLVTEFTYEGMSMTKKQSCYWGIACAVIQNMLFNSMNEKEINVIKNITNDDVKINENLNKENEEEEDKELFDSMGAEVAGSCVIKLNELLDSSEGSSRISRDKFILIRSWVLHWLLFPFFKYFITSIHVKNFTPINKVWGQLPECLLDEKSIAVINLVAPHLLRYLAVYAILNRKRKDHFQTVLHCISNAKCRYSDSFTSLLEALFVHFDFDAAQKHMADVSQSCDEDYFLDGLKTTIEEHCRLLIFETYCRIHKSINIDLIAKKVNMSPDAAERWIVNLIRHAKLEAKIDSEKNLVEMSSNPVSLYQQVIERTRNIGIRTSMLLQNLCRPVNNTNQIHKSNFNYDLDVTGNSGSSPGGYKYRGRQRQWGGAGMKVGDRQRGGGGRFDKNKSFNENKHVRNYGDNDAFAD